MNRSILLSALLLLAFAAPTFSQSNPGIKSAETLSAESRFASSNAILEQFIQDNPKRYYDLSKAWFLLSYNRLQLGDHEGAWQANEMSLELKRKLHSDELAENYMRFGAILLQKGDYERALDQLFRAKELPIEDGAIFARIDGYIAAAFQGLSRFDEAEKFHHEAIATLAVQYDPDIAAAYYNMGRFYLEQGNIQAALDTLDLARQLLLETVQRKDLLGQVYNALGEASKWDEPEKARLWYEKALSEYRTALGPFHKEIARTQINLARLEQEEGATEKARIAVLGAITSICPGDQEITWDNLPQHAEIALDRPLLAEALGLRAAMRLEEDSAGNEQLQLALTDSEKAVTLLLSELVYLGDERSKIARVKSCPYLAEPGIAAALELYRAGNDKTWLERAFALSERSKAVLFRADMPALPVAAGAGKMENELRAALRVAETALAITPLDLTARKNVTAARAEFDQFLVNAGVEYPGYDRLRYNREPVRLPDLQGRLDGETAVLTYFAGKENYVVFALNNKEIFAASLGLESFAGPRKKGAKWLQLAAGSAASTAPGAYSKLDPSGKIQDLPAVVKGYLTAIRKVEPANFVLYSHDLYNRLIAPAEDILKGRKKLVVIPDGALATMPFEALITANKDARIRYNKLDYLVSRFALHYQYSASAWVEREGREEVTVIPGFAGFAPVFEEEHSIAETNRPIFDTTWQAGDPLRSVSPDGRQFSTLAASREEIQGIAALFAEKQLDGKIFLQAEATEENATAVSGGILHLATHSFAAPGRPELSGIVFHQGEGSDGIWYAAEIYAQTLEHDLVVLSSCESGAGDFAPGEGVLALPRAFLSAGSRSVIASLWKVNDKPTSALMLQFYRELLGGQKVENALQAAKRKMAEGKDAADPRQWAGFVLYGG